MTSGSDIGPVPRRRAAGVLVLGGDAQLIGLGSAVIGQLSPGSGLDSDANGCASSAAVDSLVQTPSGSVAWIEGPDGSGLLSVATFIAEILRATDRQTQTARSRPGRRRALARW